MRVSECFSDISHSRRDGFTQPGIIRAEAVTLLISDQNIDYAGGYRNGHENDNDSVENQHKAVFLRGKQDNDTRVAGLNRVQAWLVASSKRKLATYSATGGGPTLKKHSIYETCRFP